MTHVGAIGEVVSAILAGKQLEQPRRFVGGSARGVEFNSSGCRPRRISPIRAKACSHATGRRGIAVPVVNPRIG